MSRKSMILLCAIFLTLVQVECRINSGRFLKCWPYQLKYEKFNVRFYSSSRVKSYQLIKQQVDFETCGIDFNPERRTTVIVHGFMGTSHDDLIKLLANQLLAWNDMNVLIVGWEAGFSSPFLYHQASVNTEYVAIRIKNMFKRIKKDWTKQGGSVDTWGPLHFIGFSVGAHIVGQAAELLRVEENLLVHRVTGLDPAEPCFESADNPLRLAKSNARFVDVIHTDGARTKNEAFGLLDSIGHADFYVNGGSVQPGCRSRRQTAAYSYDFVQKLLLHAVGDGSCHHARALEVFISSLTQAIEKQCKFWAHPWRLGTTAAETGQILRNPCNTTICPEMGINAELYSYHTNVFYVATTSRAPYCNT